MQKDFIALTSVIHENKLIGLLASSGQALTDETGLDSDRCIEWLYNLVHLRKRASGVIFVCYGFNKTNEFIFSTLPSGLRDKLFESHTIREQVDHLELERESIDETFFYADRETQDFEQADFERHVIGHSLNELKEVKYNGYHIELINGKVLTLRKGGKAVSIHDISGFFKGETFGDVIGNWLGKGYFSCMQLDYLSTYVCFISASYSVREYGLRMLEGQIIAKIAQKLNTSLTDHGINLSRYHGAGSLAGHILSRSHAKNYYHNYLHRRQHAPELWRGLHQAYYAGRAEQFKIGTLRDVKVYDINSAYANACTFLPTLLRKPRFVRGWNDSPFSLFYCEYDLSSANPYFGLLPNRDSGNSTRYKLKGRGYFWQPEIVFMLENYPECIEVKYGFVYDYEKAPFTAEIADMYALRRYLQTQNNPLQKVIGLGLSAIYGKFKQDKSRYYNLAYAGFITSYTRYQLLEATKSNFEDIICFQTDAIHSSKVLPVPVSPDLGEYKLNEYAKATYLDQGIYQCSNKKGEIVKTKTQGFQTFDFDKALDDLNKFQAYKVKADIFMGHNLFTQNMFVGIDYLDSCEIERRHSPLETDIDSMRVFVNVPVDLRTGFIDSRVSGGYSGRESSVYRKALYRATDINLERV